MPISFEKYVRITSGVVGNAAVRQRDLIGRIFTENALVSPDEVLEFTDPEDIKAFFGMDSEEYKRATFYFAWISKKATKAKKISFARYAPAGNNPAVYGGTTAKSLTAFQAITGGSLTITVGAETITVTGIDLSTATSFADVATAIQTVLDAQIGPFNTSVVAYDATTRRFTLTINQTGENIISVGTSQLATLLQWTRSTGALFISGSDARSAAETVSDSAQLTNNFGSFLFLTSLDMEDHIAVAAWNDLQNVKYEYMILAESQEHANDLYAALIGYSGVGVTLKYTDPTGETEDTGYPEMVPMIIMAATDYTLRNSTVNFMYHQFNLLPSVNTTALSNAMDAIRCNYYGQTQTAGQNISFYQRGILMGPASAPTDMNTFANEIWLKDYAATQIMQLFLSLNKVSANERGRTQIINVLLPVIIAALFNGVISVGKTLNETQKAFILDETGDELAWYQVQNVGYWLDCSMKTETTTDGRTEYYADYLLIYSKDDVIRRVEGRHQLI